MFWHLKKKQAQLMKEGRCFNCKKRGHITYNCSKKGKIAAILENVSKDNNK